MSSSNINNLKKSDDEKIMIHPILLYPIDKPKKKSICKKDDECENTVSHDEIYNMLFPVISFNPLTFLSKFYKIETYEDFLEWCEKNKEAPYETLYRNLNLGLQVFGESQIDIIDGRLVEALSKVIHSKFMNRIYKVLTKYITIKDNKVFLNNNSNIYTNDEKQIIIVYISETFLTSNEISKFLIRYIKEINNKWDTIDKHVDMIIEKFILYIINKIENTIK